MVAGVRRGWLLGAILGKHHRDMAPSGCAQVVHHFGGGCRAKILTRLRQQGVEVMVPPSELPRGQAVAGSQSAEKLGDGLVRGAGRQSVADRVRVLVFALRGRDLQGCSSACLPVEAAVALTLIISIPHKMVP